MPALQPNRLLNTKLMPPRLPSALVAREHLLARLDLGLARKVSLVTAPTGFGKTTLVRMWLAQRTVPFAWVTLDEGDNDPVRFWTYVCSALRALDSHPGKATLSMLASPQPPTFTSLLTPLLNDLTQLPANSALVLEDYHATQAAEIHEGVSFLIRNLPEQLHLILITRAEPALPLGILRARDELVEIHASDLRFSQQEAQAFLDTIVQRDLPSVVVASLLQKTEGWPAGLRLGALTLQNQANRMEVEQRKEFVSGSDRYIAEYLIQEVLESQPPEIQSFLLKTSFLRRLTGSLCDAILDTDHSAATLEKLERDNLFLVQLEREGGDLWYRYTPLFAESLQYLSRQRLGEDNIRKLFETASDWYEYHGLIEEAIETALTARLFDRAMTLIAKFIEIHDLSEMHTLGRWLDRIPADQILRHPIICFTFAQVILYSTNRFAPATAARIEPFLRAAEAAWRAEENHARLGQLLSFRGNVVWWQGDFPKAFEYSRQSLEELPEHDVFWRGNSLVSVGHAALSAGRILEAQDKILEARALMGAAQNIYGLLAATQFLAEDFYQQGELEQAEQLNQQILEDAAAVGEDSMLDDQGIASLNLAHIAYERNDLGQAEQLATRAVGLAQQRANEILQVQANIRLACISFAKGDLTSALERLKSLEANVQNPSLLREIQHARVLLSIRSNDLSTLEWWLKIHAEESEQVLPMQKEQEAFTLARLQIAQGKANLALPSLRSWQEDAAQNGRVRSHVEALCLQALAHHVEANRSQAAQFLSRALVIGQAKGFRRIFLDEAPGLLALVQTILPTLTNRSLQLFAASLLHAFSPSATSQTAANSAAPIEVLSQQELRVLRLLTAGLSNADIAKQLVLSTNTIKTHVKSIYRKLNVSSRSEARDVARELKLL